MRYEISGASGGTVLHLRGELSVSDRDAFDGAVKEALKPGIQKVTVEMSGLDYMDSAGLGMLLTLREEAEQFGIAVDIAGAKGEVRELLELARFDTLFDIA